MLSKFKLFVFFSALSCAANAQFFTPIKKPNALAGRSVAAADPTAVVVKNEIRPIVNVFSTAIQLNSKGSSQASVSALTGGGVSYQHLVYDASTTRWNVPWSLNALAWYTTNISGDDSKPFMYGLGLGLLNNNVLIGAATDGAGKFAITAGFGINFNN